MAILTRPLFHSQERIDLEDLNQLLSGLRTDARLWTRQLYADKNFIVKGFDVTGIGTNALTVNLLDATLLFSGRRNLTGTATIGVDDAAVVGDTVVLANSDGTRITLTGVASGATGNNFNIGSNAATLATGLGEAIARSSNDLSTSVSGTTITVTATRTGFITITASNTAPFNNTGTIIGTFDYTSSVIDSPADLSYFILESGAIGNETRLTREVASSERAMTGTASRTLFVYGRLITEQGTPITKAFWDPSANSGSGAEFNQRVDTAVDTAMELNVSTSKLNQATDADAEEFFANVSICELDVDSSGIILAIRDTRPLLFEADDERPWERTNPFATIGTAQTVNNVTVTTTLSGVIQSPTSNPFVIDEIIDVYPIIGADPAIRTSAKISNVSGSGANQTLELGKLAEATGGEPGLSVINAAQVIVKGRTSGAIQIVTSVTSNFFRDDKSLGDFRNAFSALATEINNIKGTENWYEDPPASAKDLLRFLNSTIIGLTPNARYEWNASGDGTLSIKLDPINDPGDRTELTVDSGNSVAATNTITFTRGTGTVVLTAITSGTPTNVQYLKGSDAEATASNIAGAINGDGFPSLGATFSEGASGDYVINLLSNDRAYTAVASSNTTAISVTGSPFTYLSRNTDLANIRFYGLDRQFIFRETNLTIGTKEVLFITLPDLDTDTSETAIVYDQATQFRYSQQGPTSAAGAALWNSTNRDIFLNNTTQFKTVPIADFVSNDRNYWIAYRDTSETIYIRDVGELGDLESANIGQGITNATLSYIGAPDENTSTPAYSSVTTIGAFTAEGVYTAGAAADVNESIVSQSENLTSAINDLNNHLTSIKNTQYQNLGLKLVDGGFWAWNQSSGNLTTTAAAFIQVPGFRNNRNQIGIIGTGESFNGLIDGDVLYVDINRQDNRSDKTTPTSITPVLASTVVARSRTSPLANVALFVPTRDRVVIARRVGAFLFVGVNGTMRLATGESAPLDSALQFLGLKENQLPRQLNTHLQTTGTINARAIDIGNADAAFPVGGLNTSGTFDDDITLTLPISTGVLFWEGATFDINGGRVFNEGTTTAWRSRTLADTSFSSASGLFPTTGANKDGEAYYAISISGETTIASNDSEISVLAARALAVTPNISPVVGRKKGEWNIEVGAIAPNQTGTTGRAVPPDFGAGTPVALIRVTATNGVIDNFDADTLVVLGASGGGGGGGSGDANQDLNNYLNRLNLSTFEYLTPVIPAISTIENIDVTANTTAGVASAGVGLTASLAFQTENLLDNDFIADRIIPERIEIEAYFGFDSTNSALQRIDPNAKWSISFNAADATTAFTPVTPSRTIEVAGFINNVSTASLVGTNLTNATVDAANVGLIFAENHGLSQAHKINITTATGITNLNPVNPDTGSTGIGTQFYARVVDQDSFFLYNTVRNADAINATTGKVITQGTSASNIDFNRDAGIIPRNATTNVMRAVFDQREVATLSGASYNNTGSGSVRVRVVGDASASIRTQTNDALLSSLAIFYKDELGIEGVNPNGLDDVNDILRSSHLVNTVKATAGYGVNGRGVVLLNGAGTTAEIALDSNNNVTIDGTAPITTNGATAGQILVADASGVFSPMDASAGSGGAEQIITQLGGTAARGAAGATTGYTWTCPESVFTIFLDMAGGGGGGSGGSTGQSGGGGGGVFFSWFTVVPGQTYNFLIGSAGGGGVGASSNAGGGAQSTIAATGGALLNGVASVGIQAGGGGGATTAGGGVGPLSFSGGANTIVQTNTFRLTDFRYDLIGNIQGINPLTFWNAGSRYKTSGATGSNSGGGTGGSTWYGNGTTSPGNNAGGGGAGFTNGGSDGSGGGGTGHSGGQGGIRITWYSNDETAAANPFVIV